MDPDHAGYHGGHHGLQHAEISEEQLPDNDIVAGEPAFLQQKAEANPDEQPDCKLQFFIGAKLLNHVLFSFRLL